MPPAASGPVLTVSRPIFTGAFCAMAGIGNNAAVAAEPARKLRRFKRRGMVVLPSFLLAGSLRRGQGCAQRVMLPTSPIVRERRHCEERSDEAIQRGRHWAALDCFASLAMTKSTASCP